MADDLATSAATLAEDIAQIASDRVSPLETRFAALLEALDVHFALYDSMSNPGDPLRASRLRCTIANLRTQ